MASDPCDLRPPIIARALKNVKGRE